MSSVSQWNKKHQQAFKNLLCWCFEGYFLDQYEVSLGEQEVEQAGHLLKLKYNNKYTEIQ